MRVKISKKMDEFEVAQAMQEAVGCLRVNIRPEGQFFVLSAIN